MIQQPEAKKKAKEFSPHVVIFWGNANAITVREFSYKEDAEDLYEQLLQAHTQKAVLAKVVKAHGEG